MINKRKGPTSFIRKKDGDLLTMASEAKQSESNWKGKPSQFTKMWKNKNCLGEWMGANHKVTSNKAQIGTEYLIIVAFVTFIVITTLGLALIYTAEIKDVIKMNQIENFANKLISSSESIFFSGEPSKLTITGYIPGGVNSIIINNKEIILNMTTSSGENIRVFTSRVTLEGTINPRSGVKKLQLVAQEDRVIIT